MAHLLQKIRKRATFKLVRNKGKLYVGNSFNIQFLKNRNLDESICIGFTATKKIGKAYKRNKAKRIMRELARKVIAKYGKINSYYVLIAKKSIFEIHFQSQEIELKELIS